MIRILAALEPLGSSASDSNSAHNEKRREFVQRLGFERLCAARLISGDLR